MLATLRAPASASLKPLSVPPADHPEPTGDRHLVFWSRYLPRGQAFIYFIRGVGAAPVKVGFSIDVRQRMRELRTGNPYPLELLFVVPADRSLETTFHRELRGDRMEGEWFSGPRIERLMIRVAAATEDMFLEFDYSNTPPDYYAYDPKAKRPRGHKIRPRPDAATVISPDMPLEIRQYEEWRRENKAA